MANDRTTLDGHDFVPGRIVSYIAPDRARFPMLLTACLYDHDRPAAHKASGVIFGPFGVEYVEQVRYDQAQTPRSWHWPPRNQRKKKEVSSQTTLLPSKPQPGRPLYDLDRVSPREAGGDRKRGSR